MISSALTSEFENTVGLINNLSFFESYLTTTDVDPAPIPLVSFEIKVKSMVSLFWRPCNVEPADTVDIPTVAVILSTLPFTWG